MGRIDARTCMDGATAWTVGFRIDGKQARDLFDLFGDVPLDLIKHTDIQEWAARRVEYISLLTKNS